MPRRFHIQYYYSTKTINLFLLLFSITSCACPDIACSKTLNADTDTWVSWHVQRHKEKWAATDQKPSAAFDWKLRLAESNKMEIIVSQDGTGDFTTITQAINNIPIHNTRRLVVYLNSGVYREKVNIPKTMRFVTLVGNRSDPPTITGNDTASTVRGRDGRPLTTFQSATVAVDADYFMAINVNFENTVAHVVGTKGGQAVALRISGTKASFYNCSFYGSQDTLYDHKGLHYFKNCFIQGSVDFIFGYGTSLYENCYLNSVTKKVAWVTAQKRSDSSISSGFSFKNCTVTGSGSIYLGRAWGDYSRVIFAYTFLDKIVLPQGWSDWGKRSRDEKVYYGEYKCSGGGANATGRVAWARELTDEEALPFITTSFIDGHTWIIDPSAYHL